jgi:hypothetical protein
MREKRGIEGSEFMTHQGKSTLLSRVGHLPDRDFPKRRKSAVEIDSGCPSGSKWIAGKALYPEA